MATSAGVLVTQERPHVRIAPRTAFSIDYRELWAYRELLFFFVWRDVKVRYKQTVLGIAWAVVQPVTQMIVFTLIFNRIANIKAGYGIPYPLFSFAGILPWTYFSGSLSNASGSIVGSAGLITKVYFPRLLVPIASIVTPIVDFLLAFLVLIGLFLYYGSRPDWRTIAIPFFLGAAFLTAFGVGLWLSALNVRFRDVKYLVPFVMQVWVFLTPVYIPLSSYPGKLQTAMEANPMTGVIEGFRWAVLGKGLPHYSVFFTSFGVGLVLTVAGLFYFRRTERSFADLI